MPIGYKLFHEKDGGLYPLFIDKKRELPINVWMEAENIPTKGFAPRPGWHIGEIPDAPWLKNQEGGYTSRIWAEVEYDDTVDYQEHLKIHNMKDMKNEVPVNGFYRYQKDKNTLGLLPAI